jgi:hypothetical protein
VGGPDPFGPRQYDDREVRASRRFLRYAAPRTALLALIVPVAACGGDETAAPSAAEAIDRAVDATARETSFRFRLEVENPPRSAAGLNLTHAEGEIAVPDRMRADVGGTFAGIPLESELIAVGRDEWLRNPFGGGFRKIDIGVSPLDFFDPESGVLAVLKNAEDVALSEDGDEYVITGDVAAESVDGFLGVDADARQLDVDVRIGKDDYLLHRVVVKGPANDSEPADVQRVLELSDYGAGVSVEPPG